MMLKSWMLAILAVPALAAQTPLQSWPAWKKKYTDYTAAKSSYQVKELNTKLEGSTAPTPLVADEQDLWSWYSEVGAGTEKTAAKTLMDKTYSDLGGHASLMSDFVVAVNTEYSKTANANLIDKYNNVYKPIMAKSLAKGSTGYALHQQYHALTAEQQKSVASSLERPLATKWNTDFTGATDWAAQTTYEKKTIFISNILNGVVTTPAKGKLCYDTLKAARDNGDEGAVRLFEGKMAAILKAAV